jgi:hypothetical protein
MLPSVKSWRYDYVAVGEVSVSQYRVTSSKIWSRDGEVSVQLRNFSAIQERSESGEAETVKEIVEGKVACSRA